MPLARYSSAAAAATNTVPTRKTATSVSPICREKTITTTTNVTVNNSSIHYYKYESTSIESDSSFRPGVEK
jgi:hypothetical protein